MQASVYPEPADLARRFSSILRQVLDESELAIVIDRNSYAFPGVCHSHDFCDANEVMARAFEELAGPDVDIVEDERAIDAWNEAWELAKSSAFSVEAAR